MTRSLKGVWGRHMEADLLRYPFTITRYFIPEFVTRMRQRVEVVEKPSPRQSKAMCDLLLPAYLRKGHLSFQDLVEMAVYTSKIENQELAERIAYEILLDVEESDEEPISPNDDAFMGLLSQKSDDLISYLPSEGNEGTQGEPRARYDSDIDIFKEFTSQPDLGVGPGEDELLKKTIRRNKGTRDERSRRLLAEFLKLKLFKLGREFERSMDVLLKPFLRPFEYGDDPDLIDEERSLENIFDKGKRIDDVRYDDFLIRRRNRKRRVVVYILDISNTMFYEVEGLTSIHYSIMSLIPLLWGLRRERYGLVLYESNSHIQKDVHDEVDFGELVDGLLTLITSTTSDVERSISGTRGSRTWGGTVPNGSLGWALEQLETAGYRSDRICFYFSDFVLEDPSVTSPENRENYMILERMVERGIRVLACVSPLAKGEVFAPYTENVLKRIREAGCEILETWRPIDFLEGVQTFLEIV